MEFQYLFYFPLLAVPIVLLLYFSGPLSAAGLTIIASLIGTIGVIFTAEGLFSGIGVAEKMTPVIFALQMLWLWSLFWISEKLIELRDLEKHRLQEEAETLEEVHEPFLIQEGYLQRTPQGRVLTAKGYVAIGLKALGSDQGSLL